MLCNHLILCCPFSFYLQSFPASGSFPMERPIHFKNYTMYYYNYTLKIHIYWKHTCMNEHLVKRLTIIPFRWKKKKLYCLKYIWWKEISAVFLEKYLVCKKLLNFVYCQVYLLISWKQKDTHDTETNRETQAYIVSWVIWKTKQKCTLLLDSAQPSYGVWI